MDDRPVIPAINRTAWFLSCSMSDHHKLYIFFLAADHRRDCP